MRLTKLDSGASLAPLARASVVVASAMLLLAVSGAFAQDNMALNGGAEELADGKLAHWNLYGSGSSAEIGQAEEGYHGKCAYLKLKAFTPSTEKGR